MNSLKARKMLKIIKLLFLYCSKWVGLFRLSKYLTQDGLRILCYHGFVLGDEVLWRPGMFIKSETFRKRLTHLKHKGYPVISLDDAVRLLPQSRLPASATVITIDDGFFSTKTVAHPLLTEQAYPYTIYVTSYYSAKETPVFNLVIQYMFWKTRREIIDLAKIGLPLTGKANSTEKIHLEQLMQQVIEHGHTQLDTPGRNHLMQQLAKYLGVNFSVIEETFSLLTASEISELVAAGVDIQLHTHRHQWPLERLDALQELIDNRSFLEPLTGKTLRHVCYPSGVWTYQQFPYLQEADIQSATTCDPGLNYSDTPVFALRRFLDSEEVSQIEFEAIMSGYWEYVKKLKIIIFFKKRK